MKTFVTALLAIPLLAIAVLGGVAVFQDPDLEYFEGEPEDHYPLGFWSMKAFGQAFPETPEHPLVLEASARRYGGYRDIKFRGMGRGRLGFWNTLGPETLRAAGETVNAAGRVTALAISPTCRLAGQCRLWVGAAGGGVWRTDHAMNPNNVGWEWIGDGLGTNSIGSLTLDPNDPSGNTIYVGTGETNAHVHSGAGTGLYRSANGGDAWDRIPTMIVDPVVSPDPIDFTFTRGISVVVVEPGDFQTLYVGTATAILGMTGVRGGQTQTTGFPQARTGLYKTEDGGANWTLEWVPPVDPVFPDNPDLPVGASDVVFGVRDAKLDPRDPSTVYVTAFNNAIHRSAPSLEAGGDASYKPVFAIVDPGGFIDLAMFDITVDTHTRLYVYNGTLERDPQRLYRLDDADVPAANLVQDLGGGLLVNTGAWIELTSPDPTHPGRSSWRMCGAQCYYDLVVAVPDGQPDTVYVGGVSLPGFGSPTIKSSNSGESFTAFGRAFDVETQTTIGSHVDVHAIAFHPVDPTIVFVGSDGGVVRNDGEFVDTSHLCPDFNVPLVPCQHLWSERPTRLYFMNRGLQTLQFYNVALDPNAPLRRMIGGLQDNSTVWHDGTRSLKEWTWLFRAGDGTSASGFHPTRPEVLFASFQSNNFFTTYRNGVLPETGHPRQFWVRTGNPIQLSGERVSPMRFVSGRQFLTFDYVNPDTQFTGFQHIWRTQNNGGDQAYMEANCAYPGGRTADCGDWIPLGVGYPFVSGDPDDPTRWPGDLTSEYYGDDRTRGIVVAAERSLADSGTLWAATSAGRLFISKNADGPGAAVEFVRLDDEDTPNRFVSRIFADPTDVNVAFVSYSGFNTLTPAAPGHVFKVTFNPNAMTAVFESLDYDLGDMPINTIAYDHVTGDLYAATDFGPLVLPGGSDSWAPAGTGFPESLVVDLEIVPEERLIVAATHGLGIFYANLPKVK